MMIMMKDGRLTTALHFSKGIESGALGARADLLTSSLSLKFVDNETVPFRTIVKVEFENLCVDLTVVFLLVQIPH
jgi:hypothetical protein